MLLPYLCKEENLVLLTCCLAEKIWSASPRCSPFISGAHPNQADGVVRRTCVLSSQLFSIPIQCHEKASLNAGYAASLSWEELNIPLAFFASTASPKWELLFNQLHSLISSLSI